MPESNPAPDRNPIPVPLAAVTGLMLVVLFYLIFIWVPNERSMGVVLATASSRQSWVRASARPAAYQR